MVNTNIQAPIPLSGQGLTYKPSGNYEKGEFPEFQNLEWADNAIRTRRPINPMKDGDVGAAYSYQVLSTGFIGEDDGRAAVVSPTTNWIVGGYGRKVFKTTWAPTLLPQPATVDPIDVNMISGHFVVGFIRYNNVPYWITNKVLNNTYNEIWIFKGTPGGSYAGSTTLPPTSVKIADVGFPYENQFKRVFVHKDRIFVVTSTKIYFSKATDPMTWAAPDGGFIGIEQGYVNDAVGLNDTIFITSTYKTYSYTYSTDPNTDSFLRPISSGTEFTTLVVSGNDIYVAGYNAVYQISNNNIELIKNLDEVTPRIQLRRILKLAVLGDTLYILRGYQFYKRHFLSFGQDPTGVLTNDLLTINLTNGIVSEIDFRDNLDLPMNGTDGANFGARGLISDMITPAPVDRDIPAIYFAVLHSSSSASTAESRTRFYFMNESRTTPAQVGSDNIEIPASNSAMDRIVKSTGTAAKTQIEIAFRLENFTPDGTEYLQKRFRSLYAEGLIPYRTSTKVDLYIDGTSTPLARTGQDGYVSANRVPPYPYRFRVNQKSKTLGVRIYTETTTLLSEVFFLDQDSPFFFYLTDMRTFWNYTSDVT